MKTQSGRMSVIVARDRDDGPDPKLTDRSRLESILASLRSEAMEAYSVSTLANTPANDIPACIESLDSRA